jgi:hypothetical protein
VQEDLTRAFRCNHHGFNIGVVPDGCQLDVAIPPFEAAYQ